MADPRPTEPTALNRRSFLGVAGGVAAAAVGGGLLWNSLVREHLEDEVGSGTTSTSTPTSAGSSSATGSAGRRRTLVVLQLSGGNDGLNTLVPGGQGLYFDARPTLQVKEGEIVVLEGTEYGLHPKLAPLVPLWNEGRLAAVNGVGFLEGQSRSHFQAMDLWWSALPGHARTTGWLGRWLDRSGDTTNPLRAIALGGSSALLIGDRAISTSVRDPSAFALLAPKGADASRLAEAFAATAGPLSADPDLAAAQASVPSALSAVELLAKVTDTDGGGTTSTARARGKANGQPGDLEKGIRQNRGGKTEMVELLDVAAGIIELGIGTEIIVVGVSGYDTHANQATMHPQLLDDLAQGTSKFLAAMDAQGRSEDVLVMTMSEFGRRVQENGNGTDHGQGGMQFISGRAVRGKQVVGVADLSHLVDGDLRSIVDTRSTYAAALDWLGGDTQLTDEVLGGSFDRLGLVTT